MTYHSDRHDIPQWQAQHAAHHTLTSVGYPFQLFLASNIRRLGNCCMPATRRAAQCMAAFSSQATYCQ
eukprot:1157437-Pelagomonas_calceolata.AAC.3